MSIPATAHLARLRWPDLLVQKQQPQVRGAAQTTPALVQLPHFGLRQLHRHRSGLRIRHPWTTHKVHHNPSDLQKHHYRYTTSPETRTHPTGWLALPPVGVTGTTRTGGLRIPSFGTPWTTDSVAKTSVTDLLTPSGPRCPQLCQVAPHERIRVLVGERRGREARLPATRVRRLGRARARACLQRAGETATRRRSLRDSTYPSDWRCAGNDHGATGVMVRAVDSAP